MLTTHAGALMPHIPTPPETDPYFSSVVLLLHPDAEQIVDRSQYAHALTIGSVSLSSGEPFLDNPVVMASAGIAATVMPAASLAFARAANQPFTIEYSIRIPQFLEVGQSIYLMGWDPGIYHVMQGVSSSTVQLIYNDLGGKSFGTLDTDRWYQLAISYDGANMRTYIDGVRLSETPQLTNAVSGPAQFGAFDLPSSALNGFFGYLAEVRVTIGVARYTGASYTPRTTQFPNS